VRGLTISAGVLRRAPDFRLLFLATLASAIGTWVALIALVVDVYDRTASAAWVSVLLVVEFAPLVVVGLLAGPLLDRLPRRPVVVASDLFRAAIFCVIPFASSSLQIVLFALAAGVATSCFRPAVYAGIPNLVDPADLPRANGWVQSAENVTLALGPVLGGLLVAWTGPDPAYLLNAASFVVSAALILRIRRTMEEARAESQGHWRDLVSGLALVRRCRALRAVVVVWSAVMLGSAGMAVAEVVLAKDVFGAGDLGYGVMMGTSGLGLVLGSVAGGAWVDERGERGLYVASIGLMALGIGAVAVSPSVWVAAPLLVIMGFGNGAALVCNALLVQRGVPDHLRGRAFTVAMSVSYAALGAGMLAAGPLTSDLGARAAWGISAAVIAGAVPVAVALTRGLSAEAEQQQAEPAPVPSEPA
jgi:MFS family permease